MPADVILVSMDVTSLCTNMPREEGIDTVRQAYQDFYDNKPPIPVEYLREMLSVILKENFFQFNGKNYLQTHGTAMVTKMTEAFANIFMVNIEKEILTDRVPINRYCEKDSLMMCFHRRT